MIDGKLIVKNLLSSKSQRPVRGTLRNLLFSIILTVIVLLFSLLFSVKINEDYVYSLLIICFFIFYFGWGAERLWYAFISEMFNNPFSMTAYLSRLPFWFISGGISFSFSSLLIYKIGLLDIITGTSQYLIFLYGGFVGVFIQIPLQIYTYRMLFFKNKISNEKK